MATDTARRLYDGPTRQRRRPEDSDLYRVVAGHLATFLGRASSGPRARGLPRFVVREMQEYLRCGQLAAGFARVRCRDCGDDALVAFSCEGRGFCPSCCGRRMAEPSAHLVDHVLPDVPVRQWVLSLPHAVRHAIAYDGKVCREVRGIFVRAVLSPLPLTWNVPNDTTLIHAYSHAQSAVPNTLANKAGLITSNAIRIDIGM